MGNIVKIMNLKKGGLVSNQCHPAKIGEKKIIAITKEERIETTLKTHKLWTRDPPGKENCLFLKLIEDEAGPADVESNPEVVFKIETILMKKLTKMYGDE